MHEINLEFFYAVYDGTDWTKIRELRINNEWFNVTTPWLAPDGRKLYFASDKPDGYGGSDLYYCQWKDDYWEDPVNLGPVINTKGNESYPFINSSGEFFFSSDGHPGLGGKDIFFSRLTDSSWVKPVCLAAPVNSQFDDFGIFTDTIMEQGYFSSNRNKTVDIFSFKTISPQVFYNIDQKENNYCFRFSDNGLIAIDTVNLIYKWLFEGGKAETGAVVTHCFPGPGKYKVNLDIIEKETGRSFFTKLSEDLEIIDIEQPYVNSPDFAVKGAEISFDGLKSYLPGFSILKYSWDFGDGKKSAGEKVVHSFQEKGEYIVNLELTLRSNSTGQLKRTGASRKIMVFNNAQEGASFMSQNKHDKVSMDLRKSDNVIVNTQYSAETEYQNDAIFCIELVTSPSKIDLNSGLFRNVPSIYKIKERFDSKKGSYSYTVDQYINLVATYPAYRKMVALGFKDVRIKMFLLTDPAEKELYNLIKINGALSDSYFDMSERLTSNAFIMLDQLVKLMNKYPALKLEVAVHTDNKNTPDLNQALSQKRAQLLVDYLVNRGISIKRMVPVGYGSTKPIAGNYLDKDRKLNRRIDFVIIGK